MIKGMEQTSASCRFSRRKCYNHDKRQPYRKNTIAMRNILYILTLICGILTSRSQTTEVPAEAYEWYPQYVTFLPNDKVDSVLVYANTDLVPVTYEIYKTEVTETPQLREIASTINKIMDDERVKLAYVWVGGSASPDGRQDVNQRLAGKRAEALRDYLLAHTKVDAAHLRVENLGEDWYSITEAIRKSNLSEKDRVIAIIESEGNLDVRERRLKSLDGGAAWRHLRDEIFPPYRNARMVIVCHAEEIKVEPEPEPAPEPIPLPEPIPEPKPAPEPESEPVVEPEPVIETRFYAVKNNLLWDAALIANLGFEMELGRRWSIDVPIYYSPYNITSTRKLRVLATQPELRRWLGAKAGEGHFVGLHGHIAGFNVAINDHGRYQDPERPLWGFGLGYGFALNFGAEKHWGLEFNIGAGFANYKYEAFYNRPNGQVFKTGSDTYWGITRAGITLTYKWWVPRKVRKEGSR